MTPGGNPRCHLQHGEEVLQPVRHDLLAQDSVESLRESESKAMPALGRLANLTCASMTRRHTLPQRLKRAPRLLTLGHLDSSAFLSSRCTRTSSAGSTPGGAGDDARPRLDPGDIGLLAAA